MKIVLDEKTVVLQGDEALWKKAPQPKKTGAAKFVIKEKNAYIYQMVKGSDYYHYMILIMTLFLLPMLVLFWWMSTRYLTDPLKLMVKQAKEIESGNLGYQLEKNTRSQEFEYLRESYNHMSKTLKYQFDHIYEEELALRDARIMELQSHINPHFMNNTLEIINKE